MRKNSDFPPGFETVSGVETPCVDCGKAVFRCRITNRPARCPHCKNIYGYARSKTKRLPGIRTKNGKRVYGTRRPNPLGGMCELCEKTVAKEYHHWDDTDPTKGVWVCHNCHLLIETMERFPELPFHLPEKWKKLKAEIELGVR